MFQWANGKKLSIQFNHHLYLDVDFYKDQSGCTPREFSLCKFPNIEYELISRDNLSPLGLNIIRDNSYFSHISLSETNSYYLDGYWGSEKYFYGIEDVVKRSFSPTEIFLSKIRDSRFKGVFSKKSVSLHVRRTDYLNSNGYHPVQSLSYYIESINLLGDYDFVYIFSDDIRWCKENLTFDRMVFVEGQDDVEDLWLMSLCKNNIIANSTFSWWAAWLNQNDDKKIISPKIWFGEYTNLGIKDLIPEKWVLI